MSIDYLKYANGVKSFYSNSELMDFPASKESNEYEYLVS